MKPEDEKILKDYHKKFGIFPPEPMGVPDDFYYKVLASHVNQGKPVPDNFNWYPDKPDNAVI